MKMLQARAIELVHGRRWKVQSSIHAPKIVLSSIQNLNL
jgi:hypothetical protein